MKLMSIPAESSVYTAAFLLSLTNSIAAILNYFGDLVELFVLKNDKVCAIGFQKKKIKKNLYVILF